MIEIEKIREITRTGEFENIKQISSRIVEAAEGGSYEYQIHPSIPLTRFIWLYYNERGFKVDEYKRTISWDYER